MIMSEWSFLELEEFNLFVSILDLSLAPFRLAGVKTLQGIAEALLLSNCLLAWVMISS